MPDYPDTAIQHAAEVMLRQYESQYSAEHLTWRDFAGDARAILDAVAPDLGEHAASKIFAHMEAHGANPATVKLPQPHALKAAAYRRHFQTAARIAARAFLTEEDTKRLAAEALARGGLHSVRHPGGTWWVTGGLATSWAR
jgi:hypothetical protein